MKASLTAVAAALAVSAAALGVHAQTITMTPELKKIVEAAKQEGALTVGMADEPMAGNRGTADGEKGMNKMFGTNIKVKYVVAPPYAQQGAALLTEMQAKQPSSTDIYVSTAVQFSPLAKQGLFLAEDWAKLYPARIKPEFVEGNNQAVRIYTSLPAVLYNKRFEKQVQKTDDLYDYLKPEWKGKFVTLSQQVSGMLSCGSADRIASGEMPVLVVDCASAVQNTPKFKSILGMHILRDIAQRRYGYLSVPVNAVHPNAAKLYILYYSSPEGQAALYKNTGYDMSDYPDSRRAPVVKEMQAKGVKFKDVTVAWWESQPDVTENHRAMVKLLIQSAGKK
jgi:ABC-type Fe3+ transport system substrate-binding protein